MVEPFDNLLREDQSLADRLASARSLLRPESDPDSAWPALGAAALLAVSAVAFAVSAIMVPAMNGGP
jgi:hypothetical protein